MKKVLIIGLDGATFDLINPWVKEGYLPNLKKLIDNGTSGNLKSTIPTITPCAWTSFMTGMNPGKTGIFGFNYRKEGTYDYETVTNNTKKGIPFWKILNKYNKITGIINLPTTFPADNNMNGFMVACGLMTPHTNSKGFTYPENLFEKHGLNRSKYILQPSWQLWSKERSEAMYLEILSMLRERAKVALKLIKDERWDLFMVHFHAIDWAEHAFWKYMDKRSALYDENEAKKYGDSIKNIHQETDKVIGKLLDLIDDDTIVLIMSDHGHDLTHKTINLTTWLNSLGLLRSKNLSSKDVAVRVINKMFQKKLKFSRNNKIQSFFNKLIINIYDLLHFHVQAYLDKIITKIVYRFSSIRDRAGVNYFDRIDWERTKAYPVGVSGEIYINLKGREPNGIVLFGKEYEEIRNYIINEAYKLKDDDGDALIDIAFKKEELYHGESLDKAPDIVLHTDKKVCYFHSELSIKEIVSDPVPWRTGNHKLNGIFIAKGNGIKKGAYIKDAEIIDVVPTMLYLLDIPIPKKMDGKVLKKCFCEEYLKNNPIRYSGINLISEDINFEISEEDSEKVKQSLKGLGYL